MQDTVYTYEEALSASISYFSGEELPAKIFVDKYALRNADGQFVELTPDDMHKRLAREFARIEKKKFKEPYSEDYIYSLLQNFSTIIPQGSPIFGIGNPSQFVSVSNCFVVDGPEDSYAGLLRADEELIQISKRRGGVGLDLSKPRPSRSATRNSSRTSTGTATWMQRYSNSIREVGQDGRRGALMQTLSVHHPDIETFATIKNDDTKVTGANISIRLTDEFLNAVAEGTDYEQRWPVDKDVVVAPHLKPMSKMVDAKSIWQTIIHSAWFRAEPGLLFWDNILRESPADCYAKHGFRTISTNPCGEIPLSAYDSCRLLAINLFSFVRNAYTKDAYFDFNALYRVAQVAQRLLDDLIDLEIECIGRIIAKIYEDKESIELKQRELNLWEKIYQSCIKGRRTGLGITVLGDTLAAIGQHYGDDESIKVVERIYQTLKFGSYRSSVDMAKEIGPFQVWNWELEKDNPFINRIKDEVLDITIPRGGDVINALKPIFGKELYNDIKKYGRRNIANLTTAPTGTISIMAGMNIKDKWYFNTTSGIEPCIATGYERRKKGNLHDEHFRSDFVDQSGDHWMTFTVYHSGVKAWMDVNNKTEMDSTCPYNNCTADKIVWTQRVKLQAAAQKHVDHSISSTVNLPADVTEEEVAKIYEAAWRAGCKGITVYRDGCRTGVINSLEKKAEKNVQEERPKSIPCDIHHITVKGEKYFALVGFRDERMPYEVFAGRNGFLDKKYTSGFIRRKKRGFYELYGVEKDGKKTLLLAPITAVSNEHEETITRLASLALRSGGDVHLVVQQLEKVNGEMNSFAKSVARAIKKYIPDGTVEHGEDCPSCSGKNIVRQEGCKACKDCGWTACN
jgi:ribonucleoside-diphosphate reductase alpha chain